MSIKSSRSNFTSDPIIGVIGGGQLAQMLCEAAALRKINVAIQASSDNDPATNKAIEVVLSDSTNIEGTRKISEFCKCITFENEWVNINDLKILEEEGVTFIPNIDSLTPLVDKVSQRNLLRELNIPCTDWIPLLTDNLIDFNLPPDWNFPLMAKVSRGGYDGKGTKIINNSDDLNHLLSSVDRNKWFLEKWVKYQKEYSLVASRDRKGHIRTFNLAETCQSDQVCDWVLVPADVSHSVKAFAYNIAASLLTKLNYFGVIAIEFFYGDNGLLVNEIAPRTHNSAHFSIEACKSSQFDQQVCIAAGLPVDSPDLIVPGALMINLLGLPEDKYPPLEERLREIKKIYGANLHWYGKNEEKVGRKLGHVTFILEEEDCLLRRKEAMTALKKIRSIWPIK
tara:strand:- start:70 stop:1257 length:1188 start_codon:yes stop_codon:yes gene_type:complete